ncbi:hypothetical protein [Nocardia paucivorans]|uniref:hypothetical protein n=1 Tax=Nocardia paucivorans TaxID=114259 RepID=UPI000593F627|nr:hypothetical protein [Nocardia paucivorans]
MSITATPAWPSVRLTPHPLQRVGAHALLGLAGLTGTQRHPESLTDAEFKAAWDKMTEDVVATAWLEDTKAPRAFWLAASYLFWPNSKMNTTNRRSLTEQQRMELIRSWRKMPESVPSGLSGVPCTLCAQMACGFYGKVDVPLAASVEHRNSTVPGHEGLALCRGCLASFYAMPYGCSIRGGKASALHSWDDAALAKFTARQVRLTRNRINLESISASEQRYSRETEALRALRSYEDRLCDGVELYVFSNSNKQQTLDVYGVEQPLAEWLRSTLHSPVLKAGFRYLTRAHYSPKVPGSVLLAYHVFRYPHRVPITAVDFLSRLTAELGAPPPETEALAQVHRSFIKEVLGVAQRDIDQITGLGNKIGALLRKNPQRGTLTEFKHAQSDAGQLQAWLKRQATRWTLDPKATEPLVTTEQWRLLFEPGDRVRFNRDLLFVAVLEDLTRHQWLAGIPEDRDEQDDDILTEEEDQ